MYTEKIRPLLQIGTENNEFPPKRSLRKRKLKIEKQKEGKQG